MEELRCLVPVQLFPDPSLRAQLICGIKQDANGRWVRRRVHMLVNSQAKYLTQITNAMELGTVTYGDGQALELPDPPHPAYPNKSLDNDKDIVGAKANLFLNMTDDSHIPIDIKSGFHSKPPQVLALFYAELCAMLDDVARASPSDPQQIRKSFDEGLIELWQKKIKDCNIFNVKQDKKKKKKKRAHDSDSSSDDDDSTDEEAEIAHVYDQVFTIDTDPLTRHHAPRLPFNGLQFHIVRSEEGSVFLNGALDDKTRIPSPGDMITKIKDIFNEELKGTKKALTQEERIRIDLCIVGGTVTFHRFLCAYCILAYQDPTYLNADVRVFALPYGSTNLVCKYLATYDPWYFHTIYCTFAPDTAHEDQQSRQPNSPFGGASPRMQSAPMSIHAQNARIVSEMQELNQKSKHLVDAKNLSPNGLIGRWCFNNYIQNAIFGKPIRVFVAECWGKNNSFAGINIPFCQQVEIGWMAAHHEYNSNVLKRSESDGFDLEPSDLEAGDTEWGYKLPRGFKPPQPAQLRICGVTNNLVSGRVEQHFHGKYDSIVIKNIPKDGDRGPTADPEEPHLDVFINEREDVAALATKKLRRMADVGEHFRFDFKFPEERVEVRCSDNAVSPFNVLIDGDLFGPFVRVLIRPFFTPDGAQKVKDWSSPLGASSPGSPGGLGSGLQSGMMSPVSGGSMSPGMLPSMNNLSPSSSTSFLNTSFSGGMTPTTPRSFTSKSVVDTLDLPSHQMSLKLMSFCELTSSLQ
eukprot:TRINITY_DN59256_c0_g1_i1.p1 TRINITY_DN59256_c0_g1~~TRINITY_DN59256_c0_g1_i1.p1  ORF type:complete len:836 (-),score=65.37 TRINITY_DN59256_c0_g1_i1:38-2275(-)